MIRCGAYFTTGTYSRKYDQILTKKNQLKPQVKYNDQNDPLVEKRKCSIMSELVCLILYVTDIFAYIKEYICTYKREPKRITVVSENVKK